MLDEGLFFDTLRQGLWVAVLISVPILTVALVTGLAIGLFQALTSIQEMTLTFVPKLAAIAIVFWMSMGFDNSRAPIGDPAGEETARPQNASA